MQRSLVALVAMFMMCWATSTEASPISYSFDVTAAFGPLVGQHASGTFSIDSSIIPVGGGRVVGLHLFTDFDFTWNGKAYDERNTLSVYLGFDDRGRLKQWEFGTACNLDRPTPSCLVRLPGAPLPWAPPFEDWMLRETVSVVYGTPISFFEYGLPGSFWGGGPQAVTRLTPVPEPSQPALVLLACVACFSRWRRTR